MRQIGEFVAVLACGLFTGAAVYISFVEHPARMECGVEIAATEFPPSYPRASVMQETLAAFVQITLAKVQRGLRVCTHDPSHERQEQTRETSSPQIASPRTTPATSSPTPSAPPEVPRSSRARSGNFRLGCRHTEENI